MTFSSEHVDSDGFNKDFEVFNKFFLSRSRSIKKCCEHILKVVLVSTNRLEKQCKVAEETGVTSGGSMRRSLDHEQPQEISMIIRKKGIHF